ncbi:hypothetical protein [Snodgrassella alvi]|uniref:hypothetical protein n=1 Tax=Snodgrassella alvi TaxID=1196083 RepID=UPI002740EE1F|nr:hypothetical protein [Snodgrassella alvi]WLT02928.1 hypothetical protein RAM00_03655 [Snodgrassella alvi]
MTASLQCAGVVPSVPAWCLVCWRAAQCDGIAAVCWRAAQCDGIAAVCRRGAQCAGVVPCVLACCPV